MEGANDQEVQRFTFRLKAGTYTEKGNRITHRVSKNEPEAVTIVGVKPATFNTSAFQKRDAGANAHDLHLKRDEDFAGNEATSPADQGKAAEENETLFCVTSHVVWRTSQLMASWMASHAALFAPHSHDRPLNSAASTTITTSTAYARQDGTQQLRVLELGCGLGLAGLACAKVCSALLQPDPSADDPALVVMTDGDAAALRLLERNVQLNWAGEREGRPQVEHLVWGDRPSMRALRAAHGGRPFDVVLGADIIYHRTDYHALMDTIRYFLSEDDDHGEGHETAVQVANTEALVIIAMQERQYGALDLLVELMRTRLGMAARMLDVPRMFSEDHKDAGDGEQEDGCGGDEGGEDGARDPQEQLQAEEGQGYWIGSNHYMVVFHHPKTSIDLAFLGPEMARDDERGDDEDLFMLAVSPPQ